MRYIYTNQTICTLTQGSSSHYFCLHKITDAQDPNLEVVVYPSHHPRSATQGHLLMSPAEEVVYKVYNLDMQVPATADS